MIKENKYSYYFLKDENKIENYEKAKSDTTQTWVCHHRLETHFSDGTERPKGSYLLSEELVALGMYYFRPPEELIFMTRKDHQALHNKNNDYKKISSRKIGSHLSNETKNKISESLKIHNKMYGRSGGNNTKVICIETSEIFNSIKEAQEKYGKGHIVDVCKGRRKKACGYHWKYFEEDIH